MTNFITPGVPEKDRLLAIFELYTFWPTTVPVPSSFEIKQSLWTIPDNEVESSHRPLAVVALPNGATVKIELTDPFDVNSRHETYSAGWHAYTGGDEALRNSLSDVLHKVFLTLIRGNEE